MNNANRMENEVAVQLLVREQFSAFHPELAHVIPKVYAWAPYQYPSIPNETGFAWTMCGFMPRVNLDAQFRQKGLTSKIAIVEQVATISSALKTMSLLEALKGHYRGLTFNDQGNVVGG